MIHWAMHYEYEQTAAALEWLSPAELAQHSGFRVRSRQNDWLLGRIGAKRLIRAFVEQSEGRQLDPRCIEVLSASDGAPEVHLPSPQNEDLRRNWLSLSHRTGAAFCGLVSEPKGAIGVDLELIEPRSEAFVHDYFVKEEVKAVEQAAAEARALVANLIWSAKEAVLKALRLGLSVDTRTLCCIVSPQDVALVLPVDSGKRQPESPWRPVQVELTSWLREAAGLEQEAQIACWWRTRMPHVLTLAVVARQAWLTPAEHSICAQCAPRERRWQEC